MIPPILMCLGGIMKIVSFNINSVRVRLHQLEHLSHTADFIGLQETKVHDDDYPSSAILELGYHSLFFGQKSHYGVANLSKYPQTLVTKGFPDDDNSSQRRFIGSEISLKEGEPLTIYNGYFPQGENVDHPTKYAAKRKFYADLTTFISRQHNLETENIIVMGDINIATSDLDIGIGEDNKKRWLRDGKTSFQPEERHWYNALINLGLTDTYRLLNPLGCDYSWFDYRSKGFEKQPKRGLRIDQILVSKPLVPRVTEVGIDYKARSQLKPSDHAPIYIKIS